MKFKQRFVLSLLKPGSSQSDTSSQALYTLILIIQLPFIYFLSNFCWSPLSPSVPSLAEGFCYHWEDLVEKKRIHRVWSHQSVIRADVWAGASCKPPVLVTAWQAWQAVPFKQNEGRRVNEARVTLHVSLLFVCVIVGLPNSFKGENAVTSTLLINTCAYHCFYCMAVWE